MSETNCRVCGKYNGTKDSSDWCRCPRVRDKGVSEESAAPLAAERGEGEAITELYLSAEYHLYLTPKGGIGVASNDDVPEEMIDTLEDDLPQVFDGTIYHNVEGKSAEELESMGLPPAATNYGEWWHGRFRKATPEEITAFLRTRPAPLPADVQAAVADAERIVEELQYEGFFDDARTIKALLAHLTREAR